MPTNEEAPFWKMEISPRKLQEACSIVLLIFLCGLAASFWNCINKLEKAELKAASDSLDAQHSLSRAIEGLKKGRIRLIGGFPQFPWLTLRFKAGDSPGEAILHHNWISRHFDAALVHAADFRSLKNSALLLLLLTSTLLALQLLALFLPIVLNRIKKVTVQLESS